MKWEHYNGGWRLNGQNICIALFHDPENSYWYSCHQVDDEDHPLIAISLAAAQREAVRYVTMHIRKLHTESEMMFQKFGKAKSVKEEIEK